MKKLLLIVAISALAGCSFLEKLTDFGIDIRTPVVRVSIGTVESNTPN